MAIYVLKPLRLPIRMEEAYSGFDRQNLIEKDAATFVGKILGKVRDRLPYGDLRYDASVRDYKPSPPMAFRRLGAMSNYIQRYEVHPDTCFPDKMLSSFFTAFDNAVALSRPERVQRDILSSGIRDGIIEVIWRTHECILFVSEKTPQELQRYLAEIRGQVLVQSSFRDTGRSVARSTTLSNTWGTDVNEWRDMVKKWTEYLALFDSVFPRVFWDSEGAILLIAQRYPRLFWEEFWAVLAPPSPIHFTEFQQLMVHTIAPQLIASGEDRPHKARALQGLLNRTAEDPHRFSQLMSRRGMNEGLIATDTTLYPRPEYLSAETRDSMVMDVGEQGVFLPP